MRKERCPERPSGRKAVLRKAILLGCGVLLFSACALGDKTVIPVRQYALEYAPPAFGDQKPVPASIRLESLSIARNYNGTAMVYRKKAYLYGDDAYNVWRVRPSEMVSDLLLRDLRNAGLFRGVFSSYDGETAPYVLGGTIEEFYELEEAGGSKAIIGMNVVLIENRNGKAPRRTLFQKSYRALRSMDEQSPEALARAASFAMESISRQIISDTCQAIRISQDAKN